MRFQYSITSPTHNEFDSLPRLPLMLRREDQEIEAVGLVDSGATVSVLPHELGLQLGEIWTIAKLLFSCQAILVINQRCLLLRALKSKNFRQSDYFLRGYSAQTPH